MTSASTLYLWLVRIFLCTSLAGSVAWIIDYTRTGWWRNSVGTNLVTKTIIITLLLTVSLLVSFFKFDPFWLDVIRWADLGLVALIGPVMVWRMLVFHHVSGAMVKCLNGHWVSSAAKFCPVCGQPVPPINEEVH